MATGTVVRFNEDKGYGFIAPDGGEDDDVFVHANDLNGARLRTGTRVEFEMIDSERGLKAYNVLVIEDPLQPVNIRPSVAKDAASVRLSTAGQLNESRASDGSRFEVLSESEFRQRMTELLLASAPQLTGTQINELRTHLLEFARKNGWVGSRAPWPG
jgi:cold shock CspA family protein